MGELTNTNVVATELENVRKKIPLLFERDDHFYSGIEKRDVEIVSARDMRVPLEIAPGGYFGQFDSAGGDLGLGGGAEYQVATLSTVNFKYAIQWQKKAQWATDKSRKSTVNAVQKLIASAMANFRRHVDAMCMTGGNGVLGTITSVANSASKDTYTCTTDGFGVKLLTKNQKINVYDATLATQRTTPGSEPAIDLYNLAAKTVRVAEVSGAIATDLILVEGVTGASPVSLYGIPYHHNDASTGTWLGLDRANFPEIRANRVTAGAALALPFPRLALNKVGDRLGIDQMKKLEAWMHPCQVQAYEELGQLVQIIQKQSKDEALNMYFGDNLQMAGSPVKKHFLWDKTRIDFVNKETWGRAEMLPAQVYEEDGNKVFPLYGTSGGIKTSSVSYIVASFQLFNDNPAACAYISGLTVPTGY